MGRLGDYLEQVIDNRGKTPPNDTKRTSFELLEVNCLTGSGRRPNYEVIRKFLTRETYNSWFRNGHPKNNDVIISTVGSIGEVCISEGRGSIAQNLIALSPNPDALTGEFLYYYLCSQEVKNELLTLNISSVQPSIKVPHLLDLEISHPPLPEQKAITHILGSLDDKIELNRKMNATLEAMAQALFKSWFVDFDPVIDNALAAGNPIPDELANRAEVRRQALSNGTANRDLSAVASAKEEAAKAFPDSFQETEAMGWIPEGWEITTVGNHVSLQRGTTYKSRLKGLPGPYLLGLGAIQRNGGFKEGKLMTYGGESPAKITIGPGDIFVSLKDLTQAADLLGSVARIPPHISSGRLTQDTVALVFDKEPISKDYLYNALLAPRYRDYCRNYSTGTTNLGLAREDFFSYPVPKPAPHVQELYNIFVSGNQNKHQVNTAQANSLTKLRDTLLPKLISGEIGVFGSN